MGDRRRSFSREFKLEAVRLVTEGGLSLSQAARDLGVAEGMLGRWPRRLVRDPGEAFPGQRHLKSQDDELRRLGRENEVLRQGRGILKERLAFFLAGAPMKYRFVHDLRADIQCGACGGSRMCRPAPITPGEQNRKADECARPISSWWRSGASTRPSAEPTASPAFRPSSRSRAHHGLKRVARLMGENDIQTRRKRKFKTTTDSRHSHPVAPNLLQRDLMATTPNQPERYEDQAGRLTTFPSNRVKIKRLPPLGIGLQRSVVEWVGQVGGGVQNEQRRPMIANLLGREVLGNQKQVSQ